MTSESALIAEVVLSQGTVKVEPLRQALDQLREVVQITDPVLDHDPHPLAAVLSPRGHPLEIHTVWSRYLHARDRACSVLRDLWVDDRLELSRLNARAGIEILFIAVDDAVVRDRMSTWTRSHAANPLTGDIPHATSNDVVLLLADSDFVASAHRSRYCLLVRGPEEFPYHPPSGARRAQALPSVEDPTDVTPAPTLTWRNAFLREVPTWSAEEVAKHGGYTAKNTSAAASRWAKEGKIFSVPHGGRQHYPQFQFRHGQPLPVVARILRELGPNVTGWDCAFFFATPNTYLDDHKPMDRLKDKDSEALLMELAARHAHPADVF